MSDPRDRGEDLPPANDMGSEIDPGMQDESSAEIVREAARIRELSTEVADLKERYLRAVAETENVRKRAEREKNEVAQFAFQRFARDLLSVVDNFNRALESVKPEARASLSPSMGAVIDGIEATQRELLATFERYGIKKIEAKGQRFNPNLHQAIAEMPSADHASGIVIDVAQCGYTLGERLLRPAMVMVSSGPGSTRNAAPPGANVDTSA